MCQHCKPRNIVTGSLVRNAHNGRRAVVSHANETTVTLQFAEGRNWTASREKVERNYRVC